MNKPIEISSGIIFKTILILIGIYFIYLVRDAFALLFIAFLIVATIEPIVNWLQRKKIPRSVGILLIYFILFLFVVLFFYLIIPPLEREVSDFVQNAPKNFGSLEESLASVDEFFQGQHLTFSSKEVVNQIKSELSGYFDNIFKTTVGLFTGFISTIIVLTLAFYMSVEEDGVKKFVVLVTPERHKEYAVSLVERINNKIIRWMHGQLFLMFTIFVLDFIGLSIVGVPYALFLAIFSGIMEVIPYAGPLISAMPGIFLGFLVSPMTGFLAFLVYLIAQQFESHVIIPQVMKKAVGLNPVVIIMSLLVGAKLGGILGAILAIPIATAAGLFLSDVLNKRTTQETN